RSDSDRDTASMVPVQIAYLRHDIDVRQKALKEAAGDIAKRMAARQLNSAQRLIQGVRTNTATCDSRFRQWEFETSQGLGQADRLVQSADEQFGRDPKQALVLYQSALAINVEQPGIGACIVSVRAADYNCVKYLNDVV